MVEAGGGATAVGRPRTSADRTRADHPVDRVDGPPDRADGPVGRADGHAPVVVRVLGPFEVCRAGRSVPASAWGSRKARLLCRLLAVRGGRGATREELADRLWPDQPYDVVANRLSVALSVIRSVVAGDGAPPRRGTPPRGTPRRLDPVRADGPLVALDPEHVVVDLDRFLDGAAAGLRAAATGERSHAIRVLSSALECHRGDLAVHEDDDIDLEVRAEQVRTTRATVARTLARLVRDHDPDQAVLLLLDVLARDPYDEPSHLALCQLLTATGRHGEARRRRAVHAAAMRELGLPSAAQATPRPRLEVLRGR